MEETFLFKYKHQDFFHVDSCRPFSKCVLLILNFNYPKLSVTACGFVEMFQPWGFHSFSPIDFEPNDSEDIIFPSSSLVILVIIKYFYNLIYVSTKK